MYLPFPIPTEESSSISDGGGSAGVTEELPSVEVRCGSAKYDEESPHRLHLVVDPLLPPKAYLHLCHRIEQNNLATWTEGRMDDKNESSCWYLFRMECHEGQLFYRFCVNVTSMSHSIEIS